MSATAYYNENDPFAAAWLRELMRDDLIAPGWIDERSIADVRPCDVEGFTQCHFFAGIGVWSLALRIAGWPDDRPIWTGSAPCQPFSAAGKGDGFDDERHLWPAWYWLIANAKRRDCPVVGEQVAAKAGRAWFDLVSSDMEALDHGCGAVDTSAASLGAPFIGQRLYWLAASDDARRQGWPAKQRSGSTDQCAPRSDGVAVGLAASETSEREHAGTIAAVETNISRSANGSDDNGVAASDSGERERGSISTGGHDSGGADAGWAQGDGGASVSLATDRLAPPTSGQSGHRDVQSSGEHRQQPQDASHCDDGGIPLHPTEYWRDADWLLCRDPNGARFRPVEPGTFPLVDARAVRNRLAAVRGAGNALNVSQAACFIEAVMEYLDS